MHLRTAVIQLNSRDNPAENLAAVERFLDHAAGMGAQLVGLPEFWTYLGPYAGFAEAAQTIPGPAIERLQEKARRHKMIVHGGSIIERHPDLNGKFYNTSVLINRNGEISARYRKIHLFDVDLANGEKHHESERIAPGNEIVTAEVGYLPVLPCIPAVITGKSCCARGPSKTSATSSPPRMSGNIRPTGSALVVQ